MDSWNNLLSKISRKPVEIMSHRFVQSNIKVILLAFGLKPKYRCEAYMNTPNFQKYLSLQSHSKCSLAVSDI